MNTVDRLAVVFGVLFGLLYLLTANGEPIYAQLGLFATFALWGVLRGIGWALHP